MDLKDHVVPNPVPWAGKPPTGPDCSKPYPAHSLGDTGHRYLPRVCSFYALCSSVAMTHSEIQAEASQLLLCLLSYFCKLTLRHIYLTCFYQADFAVLAEDF